MVTTAGDFLAHCKAGLQLIQENQELGWLGTMQQWEIYNKLIA